VYNQEQKNMKLNQAISQKRRRESSSSEGSESDGEDAVTFSSATNLKAMIQISAPQVPLLVPATSTVQKSRKMNVPVDPNVEVNDEQMMGNPDDDGPG
jgi:hypothetical protein